MVCVVRAGATAVSSWAGRRARRGRCGVVPSASRRAVDRAGQRLVLDARQRLNRRRSGGVTEHARRGGEQEIPVGREILEHAAHAGADERGLIIRSEMPLHEVPQQTADRAGIRPVDARIVHDDEVRNPNRAVHGTAQVGRSIGAYNWSLTEVLSSRSSRQVDCGERINVLEDAVFEHLEQVLAEARHRLIVRVEHSNINLYVLDVRAKFG